MTLLEGRLSLPFCVACSLVASPAPLAGETQGSKDLQRSDETFHELLRQADETKPPRITIDQIRGYLQRNETQAEWLHNGAKV